MPQATRHFWVLGVEISAVYAPGGWESTWRGGCVVVFPDLALTISAVLFHVPPLHTLIQNFEDGFFDEQLMRLIQLLKLKRIW